MLVWTFILVTFSVLIGLFSPYLKIFYIIYIFFSLFVLGYFLSIHIRKNSEQISKINVPRISLYWLLVALPVFFNILLILFHSITVEWDVIYLYLPYSKSIDLTGSMLFDVYSSSVYTTGVAPAEPIMLSFLLTFCSSATEIFLIAIIPIIFYVFTILITFELANEFLEKEFVIIPILIFANLPLVSYVFSGFSLYLDIPFVFYIYTSLFCVFKALKYRDPLWYIFSGLSITMLLLTKDLSLFIAPVLFSLLLSGIFKSTILRRVLIVTVGLSPFYLLILWNYFSGVPTSSIRFLTFVLLIIPIYFCCYVKSKPEGLKKFIPVSLALFPFIVFILRNIFSLNTIYSSWGPPLGRASQLLLNARGIGLTEFYSVTGVYPKFDDFFFSLNLVAPYLILLVSLLLLFIIKRETRVRLIKSNFSVILLLFLTLLFVMLFFDVGVTGSNGIRRLYYFAPALSIIIASSLYELKTFLKISYQYVVLSISIYVMFIWYYLWNFKLNPITVLGILNGVSFGKANLFDFLIFCLLFLLLFIFIPLLLRKSHLILKKFNPLKWANATKWISRLIVIGLSCIMIISLSPVLMDITSNSFSLRTSFYPNWEHGMNEIISYYNNDINDSYATVGFYTHALRYFSNRTVIDLTGQIGILSFEQYLTCNDSAVLLNVLSDSNIRYFLIPKDNNPHYGLYKGLQNNSLIFNMLETNPQFFILKEFSSLQLYKFVTINELTPFLLFSSDFYDAKPIRNSSMLNFQTDYLTIESVQSSEIILDFNQTDFWQIRKNNTDLFTIKNDQSLLIDDNTTLQITLNITSAASIYHIYEQPQNWGNTPFLKFGFFGSDSQKRIVLTFHSSIWTDYFYYDLKDNTAGWCEFDISLNDLIKKGNPTTDSICYIEILFGEFTNSGEFLFNLGRLKLYERDFGLQLSIPKMQSVSGNITLFIEHKALMNNDGFSLILLDCITGNRLLTFNTGVIEYSSEWTYTKVILPSNLFKQENVLQLLQSLNEDNGIGYKSLMFLDY